MPTIAKTARPIKNAAKVALLNVPRSGSLVLVDAYDAAHRLSLWLDALEYDAGFDMQDTRRDLGIMMHRLGNINRAMREVELEQRPTHFDQ